MEEIRNYNCDGMCVERTCSKRYTRMTTQAINGLKLVLGFCEEHSNEFEDFLLNKIITPQSPQIKIELKGGKRKHG